MCILYWSTMALPRKLYSRLQGPLFLPAAGAHGVLGTAASSLGLCSAPKATLPVSVSCLFFSALAFAFKYHGGRPIACPQHRNLTPAP